MQATYLVLLIIGLGGIWFGFKVAEEVYRIAIMFTGVILLVMGFISAPALVQIGVLLFVLGHQLYAPQIKF